MHSSRRGPTFPFCRLHTTRCCKIPPRLPNPSRSFCNWILILKPWLTRWILRCTAIEKHSKLAYLAVPSAEGLYFFHATILDRSRPAGCTMQEGSDEDTPNSAHVVDCHLSVFQFSVCPDGPPYRQSYSSDWCGSRERCRAGSF